ncbi:hypothetical protein [Jannaschia rubra]|uniref:Uncharacterized protein n=1 Tax=Jannaschia rubra TaxID=282197 RepID=A0A0M6XQ08_9RHOB|nr:hypothetical protein [Jannaschia rubra]CTQ33246.1 hypothetical protein JAN5088_02027 [Jannaschia rubra]SFF97749.1 hypothetical protein SAMN04488517_10275 [Jannaschia rubra]
MQIFSLLSDILLLSATLGMALWCHLLTRRLRGFDDAEKGPGAAIADLKVQVDALAERVAATTRATDAAAESLRAAIVAADDRTGRMEMLMISLGDLEDRGAERLAEAAMVDVAVGPIPGFRAARTGDAAGSGR